MSKSYPKQNKTLKYKKTEDQMGKILRKYKNSIITVKMNAVILVVCVCVFFNSEPNKRHPSKHQNPVSID